MRSVVLLSLMMGLTTSVYSQSDELKINTTTSVLSLQSQDKGILLPRMTSAQKSAISNAVPGLMIYQTDRQKGIYQYNGTKWVNVGNNPIPYHISDGLGMEGNSLKINISGQATGDMFYYTGTQWVRIPPGNEGQRLCLVDGIPTWVN